MACSRFGESIVPDGTLAACLLRSRKVHVQSIDPMMVIEAVDDRPGRGV